MAFIDAKPFWRDTPLPVAGEELLIKLFEAHKQSSFRPNLSSQTVAGAATGSGDYLNAIAAGLLTLGGLHAPISQTYSLLTADFPGSTALALLSDGFIVPGWGCSFVKGDYDQLWEPVRGWFTVYRPDIAAKIDDVTASLHLRGKDLYPNPACFTAAAAIALQIPKEIASWLFVQGRLSAWTQIAAKVL